MLPTDIAGITLLKFPTHETKDHCWLILRDRLRTEPTSSVRLAVDGSHIKPGSLVFSLPPAPLKDLGPPEE